MPLYDEEALEKFRLSGKILRETREEMRSYVREGMPIIEVCEKAEALIRAKGGKPAFPCNVSINEVAAHYTSPPDDKNTIPERSVVKVDIGVHIDGYVTDTAFTACFNPEYRVMVETAELALKTAISTITNDISTSTVGAAVETAIKNRGFRPISNLTGHSVGRYLIHAGKVYQYPPDVFKQTAYRRNLRHRTLRHRARSSRSIEDYPQKTIFRLVKAKAAKSPYAKQLTKFIEENFSRFHLPSAGFKVQYQQRNIKMHSKNYYRQKLS